MTDLVPTDTTATLSEFQSNPLKILANGHGLPVAVFDQNVPVFYCVPAEAYEAILELLDDMTLLQTVNARAGEPVVKVTLDKL